MAVNKNGIVVLGAIFVDIKGFPEDIYVPDGRNAGHVEYIHGGVSRNVVEDIANLELRPTFLGIADNTALGEDVVRKLQRHKVNTEYMKEIPNGMGTWLAVFDHNGDLAGSISQRPNLMPILGILEENGDEIIANCDSVVAEIDMDKDIIKKLVQLCEKHEKKLYGVVSNMNIAVGRRDLLQKFDCLICNQLEAGVFFSNDYSEKNTRRDGIHSCRAPESGKRSGDGGNDGRRRRCLRSGKRGKRLLSGTEDPGKRHDGSRGCILCRRFCRPDLRKNTWPGCGNRYASGCIGHHIPRKCLPALPAGGIWHSGVRKRWNDFGADYESLSGHAPGK